MEQEPVEQRPVVVAGPGVYDQPGGLVDDYDVVVFVDHVEVHLLGDEVGRGLDVVLVAHHVALVKRVMGLLGFPVDGDLALLYQGLALAPAFGGPEGEKRLV